MPSSSPFADEPFVVYANDGTGQFTSISDIAFGGEPFAGHLRQIAVGDIDADGDPDIYGPDAGTGDPDVLFVNDGSGVFTDEGATRLPAGLSSSAGATRFGDADNDGDLDLFVGDRFSGGGNRAAHLYLNDGTGSFTDASLQMPNTAAGDVPYDFDLFDADRDFDLDLLIDMHAGTSMLWTNDGAGTFSEAPFLAQGALKYGPVACDVDADSDLDVWFDNAGPNYTEELLINDGTGILSDETAQRVSGNPSADDNGLSCIDVDGDGDLDAAVASLSDEERILINDGAGNFALQPNAFSPASDSTLWFEFGDVDGDGRLDVVTGQGESGDFQDRLYLGTEEIPVDTVPPKLVAVEGTPATVETNTEIAVRFAVSDNATTDEGPRLQSAFAQLTVGDFESTPADAVFVGGDLFRVVLPAQPDPGTITWSVCATDRQANQACSAPATYEVVPAPPPPDDTGPPPPDDTGAPPPDDTEPPSVEEPPPDGDERSCGCATQGGGPWMNALLLVQVFGFAFSRSRISASRT